MSWITNHKFKFFLSLALLISLGLSIYSLANVDQTSTFTTFGLQSGNREGGFKAPDSSPSVPAQDGSSSSTDRGAGPAWGQGSTDGTTANPGFTRPSGTDGPMGAQGARDGMSGMSGMGRGGMGGFSGFGNGQYGKSLAVYAVIFGGLLAAAFYYTLRGRFEIKENRKPLILGLLLASGLFLKIAAAPWITGYQSDINFFKTWATQAADSLSGFYLNSSSDYPPLYMYVLYLTGKIVTLPQAVPYFMPLIKLPSILADTVTAYLLYKAARRFFSFEMGLWIAAFYMFNPAVLINATFWGQVDSFFTMIVVAGIFLLTRQKWGWATAVITLSVLMKPQGIIYVPVLFFALVQSRAIKPWLKAAGAGILTTLIVVLPFSSGQEPLWLYNLYTGTVNEYPYASVNAYNLFALLGANYTESASTFVVFSYHTWGLIFIVLTTLYTGWMVLRSRNTAIVSLGALLQIAGVFTFSSSMHERYLFPAAALAVLAYAYWRDKRLLWLAFGFSTTIFLNTYAVFYGYVSQGSTIGFLLFTTSLLNIAMCGLLIKVMWDVSSKTKSREALLPAVTAVVS